MNPLTNVKNTQQLSKNELDNCVPIEKSWHQQYKESAWIFIGGLSYDITEGDVISVFSQYGEVVNINLIRDHKTGKSKGYAFLCYEDQRSTILAVDNLNGTKLLNRITRVNHVENYKVPKMKEDMNEERKKLFLEGCAPKLIAEEKEEEEEEVEEVVPVHDYPRVKKESIKEEKPEKRKKEKKRKKKKRRRSSSSSEASSTSDSSLNSEERKKHKKKKR